MLLIFLLAIAALIVIASLPLWLQDSRVDRRELDKMSKREAERGGGA